MTELVHSAPAQERLLLLSTLIRSGRLRLGLLRNSRWVGIVPAALIMTLCLLAPWIAPYSPTEVDLETGFQFPSSEHWLGTDSLGRDVLSRVLWAGRISISVTAVVLSLALCIGLTVGILSGYFGGWVDDIGMRVTEFFDALPQIILALAIIGAVGPSLPALVGALAATGWVRYARLARSLVLVTRVCDYVIAAHALGASRRQIMQRHLLPAVAGPVAVQVSLDAGTTILAIAGLSFLGLGVQPPTPEWGILLVEARPFLGHALHLVLPPGLAILLVVLGYHALGEWLDDRSRPARAQ